MKKYLLIVLFLFQVTAVHAHDGSVVCLHGFFRSYKCMIPIANSLRSENLDVYLWDYPSRRKTIEQHADDLVKKLNQIAKQNPGEPIHFVTHSLGGVIVRAAVNHPDCPPEAQMGRAVLYAPPNQGSLIARKIRRIPIAKWIFGKKAGTQLLTYSSDQMNSYGEFPDTMHILVVAGVKGNSLSRNLLHEPNDGKVTLSETQLNTPHDLQIMYVSHTWIMKSRESIALTKEFILKEKP